MKRNRIRRLLFAVILVLIFLGITSGLVLWFGINSQDASVVRTDIGTTEYASQETVKKLCVPAFIPVELDIDLLNDPQSSGDVAEFKFDIKSLTEFDHISAYFITPAGASRISGEDWAGILAVRESKQLNAGIRVDTEDPVTLRAVVKVTKGDSSFVFSKGYQLDLGEKNHAALEPLAISGFSGADSLNLIVPKP